MVQTQCTPVSSRCRCSSIAASTSMLFLRRLPPNEAWLLVFRDRVLTVTAVFIRDSVTEVEMIRMRPGPTVECPWCFCFLTHHSAGKQARQLHLSSCATWDLQNASTIKISANQSLCLMVHTCPKKFTKCKLIQWNNGLFVQSLHWFAKSLHIYQRGDFPRKNPRWCVNLL